MHWHYQFSEMILSRPKQLLYKMVFVCYTRLQVKNNLIPLVVWVPTAPVKQNENQGCCCGRHETKQWWNYSVKVKHINNNASGEKIIIIKKSENQRKSEKTANLFYRRQSLNRGRAIWSLWVGRKLTGQNRSLLSNKSGHKERLQTMKKQYKSDVYD